MSGCSRTAWRISASASASFCWPAAPALFSRDSKVVIRSRSWGVIDTFRRQRRPASAEADAPLIVALFIAHDPSLRWVALVLGLVFLVGTGFAFYHLGVEQHWFAGPSACTASSAAPTTLEEMRQRILIAQVVRCDAVQWSFYGVS